MRTEFSKQDILNLLNEFHIIIPYEFEKELDDSGSPFFKELENAVLDFHLYEKIKPFNKKSVGDSSLSLRFDDVSKQQILAEINLALIKAEASAKYKEFGESGKLLATAFHQDRLTDAATQKDEIIKYWTKWKNKLDYEKALDKCYFQFRTESRRLEALTNNSRNPQTITPADKMNDARISEIIRNLTKILRQEKALLKQEPPCPEPLKIIINKLRLP